MNILKKLSFR